MRHTIEVSFMLFGTGGEAFVVLPSGERVLGARATSSQILELHNSSQTGRKKRLKPTIELRKQSINLADMYNAVQQCGGWVEVRTISDVLTSKLIHCFTVMTTTLICDVWLQALLNVTSKIQWMALPMLIVVLLHRS